MAANPWEKGELCGNLRHQGICLGILTDGRIRVDQENRVEGWFLGEVGNQLQCGSSKQRQSSLELRGAGLLSIIYVAI